MAILATMSKFDQILRIVLGADRLPGSRQLTDWAGLASSPVVSSLI
jgi:hypothetical protein